MRLIHAGAVLGSDGFGFVRDEHDGRYYKFPQIGRLEIGNDVEIGANATIDRGALEATAIADGRKTRQPGAHRAQRIRSEKTW